MHCSFMKVWSTLNREHRGITVSSLVVPMDATSTKCLRVLPQREDRIALVRGVGAGSDLYPRGRRGGGKDG